MSLGETDATEEILRLYGMTIAEDVYSPMKNIFKGEKISDIPVSTEYVREALLDIDIQIPNTLQSLFEEELHNLRKDHGYTREIQSLVPPPSAYYSPPEHRTEAMRREIAAAEQSVQQIAEVAQRARRLAAESASQATWEHFLRSYFFQSFEESKHASDKKRNVSIHRIPEILDAWYLESNIAWRGASKNNAHIGLPLGSPKPSFTYGFPVHTYDANQQPAGLRRHGLVANFSIESLNYLQEFLHLKTCPVLESTSSISKKNQKPIKSELVCFPWAVVEIHAVSGDEERAKRCYYKACYESYYALNMLEDLYVKVSPAAFRGTPPVISFTCFGSEIRVWLTFGVGKYFPSTKRMVCIWAGTLETTWCVLYLQEIIKNATFWATRILKPELSSYIKRLLDNPLFNSRNPTKNPSQVPPEEMLKKLNLAENRSKPSVQAALLSTQEVPCPPKTMMNHSTPLTVARSVRGKIVTVRLPKNDNRLSGIHRPNISGAGTQGLDSSILLPQSSDSSQMKRLESQVYFDYRTFQTIHTSFQDALGLSGLLNCEDDDEEYDPNDDYENDESDVSSWDDDMGVESVSLECNEEEASTSSDSDGIDTDEANDLLGHSHGEYSKKRIDMPSKASFPPAQMRLLSEEDVNELKTRAAKALDTSKFIKLKAVEELLQDLTCHELHDAIWRCSEALVNRSTTQKIRRNMIPVLLASRFEVLPNEGNDQHTLRLVPPALSSSLHNRAYTRTIFEGMSKINLRENLLRLMNGLKGYQCLDVFHGVLNTGRLKKIQDEAFDIVQSMEAEILICNSGSGSNTYMHIKP